MSGESAQLRKILQPSRLALVGASSDPQSLSGRYLEHLTRHGYPGEIVPVNPRRDEIGGLKCAASVTAIEGHIDTAVVIVDGDKVLGVVDECVAREIPGIVVFSSGFSEAGPAGVERQRLIMERVRSTDGRTRLIGPNSPGFVNYHAHTAVAASAYLQQAALKAGDVAVVSQSGAIGGIIASRCLDRGIGLSHLVFTGNEADVSAADCIEALAEDDNVTAIVAVVETLRDLRRFREAAEHAKRLGRTILVLRIGVSAAGRRAAMAHTGALANDSHTVDAILNRVGAVVARDIDEMMNLLDARRVVAPGFNGRLGVLCTSGGLASMAADAVSQTGITLPKLSERAAARLGELIPDFGSTLNPTDLTGMIVQQPELAEHCLVGLDDDGFDVIVAVLTVHPAPLSVTLAQHLIAGRRVTKTPLVVAWETGSISDDGIATLREAGIPTFNSLTGCLGALARLADGAATVDRDDDEVLGADENQTTLPEHRVLELLEPHGLPGPESGLAKTRGEAQMLADRLGYPLVAKIQSAQLPHRSRVGGVRLALDSRDAVEKAFDDLSELAERLNVEVDGISLSESIEEGRDLFVGLRLTEAGWMLVLAPGGSDVENSASVHRSLLPLESDSAETMVTTVLDQATAEERAVLGRAVDRVVLAAETLPEGAMVLELNPVRVHAGRLVVLDALVELAGDDKSDTMSTDVVQGFKTQLAQYMAASNRSEQRSTLFDLPSRSVLGGACFYENLPELLAMLDAPPTVIAARMRVLGSRPYLMHLNSMLFGFFTGMAERGATAGESRADRDRLAATVDFWQEVMEAYRGDGIDFSTGRQCVLDETSLLGLGLDQAPGRHPRARDVGLLQSMNFLLHGESRDGVFDHGPYLEEDGTCVIVKELTDLRGLYHKWAVPSGAAELVVDRVVVIRRVALPADAIWFDMFGTMKFTDPAAGAQAVTHEVVLAQGSDAEFVPIEDLVSADELATQVRSVNRGLIRILAGLSSEERIGYGGDMYANMLVGFGRIGADDFEQWEAELGRRFQASTRRALTRIRTNNVAEDVWSRIGAEVDGASPSPDG